MLLCPSLAQWLVGEDVALLGPALEGEPIVTVLVTGLHGDLLVGFELSVLLKVVYMGGRVEQLIAAVPVEMVNRSRIPAC